MSSDQIISGFLVYSLQVGLLIAVALPLPAVLGLKRPDLRLRYYYLLLCVCLLLPFGPTLLVGSHANALLPEFHIETLVVVTGSAPGTSRAVWPAAALIGLAAVGLLKLVRLAVGVKVLAGWALRSSTLTPVPAAFERLRPRFGTRPLLRVADRLATPVSFGWRKPVILVPPSFAALDARMQEAILCHEWLHVERRDWPAAMLEQFLRSMFWFHPAVLILLDRIQLSREQIVDRECVRMTGRVRTYMKTLQHAALTFRQASCASTIPFIRAGHLKQRVVLLTQEVSMSQLRQWFVCSILVVAVAAVSAAVLTAVPAPGVAPSGLALGSASSHPPALQAEEEKKGEEKEGEIGISEEVDVKTRLVKRVNPVYPPEAKEQGITGRVLCQVRVGEDGRALKVEVKESPHDLLSESAIAALKQWEWAPVEKDGKRIAFTVDVTINFKLS